MYMLLMEGNLKRCMYMYIIVHNTKRVKGLIRADDSLIVVAVIISALLLHNA